MGSFPLASIVSIGRKTMAYVFTDIKSSFPSLLFNKVARLLFMVIHVIYKYKNR